MVKTWIFPQTGFLLRCIEFGSLTVFEYSASILLFNGMCFCWISYSPQRTLYWKSYRFFFLFQKCNEKRRKKSKNPVTISISYDIITRLLAKAKQDLGVAQLVARYLGVVEAASSSLVTQTKIRKGVPQGTPFLFSLKLIDLSFANACVCRNARIDKTVENHCVLPRV